jgi:hypothetical protein
VGPGVGRGAVRVRGVGAAAGGERARALFSRNKKAREIDRALTALVDAGRLRRHHGHDGTGRPAEIWIPLLQAS